MTRGKFVLATVTAFVLGVTPAMAQRSSEGGERSGSAVDRGSGSGGGGEGGAVPRSSGSGDSGSSSSSSASSDPGVAWSSPSSSSAGRDNITPPSRPTEREQSRRRGDDGGREAGGRSVSRGGDGDRSSRGPTTTRSAGSSASADEGGKPADRAVPTYSRPRDGRQPIGSAVGRQGPRVDSDLYWLPSYYSTYGGSRYSRYYWPGYGFGLGFYYDPLWYDPFYYGGAGGGYYGGGYGYQGGYGGGSYSRSATGSLRLKIKPRDAQVYVDGYFVGTVDEFDGMFQKLGIDAGGHRIELRADGYEPTEFEVLITPGETVTYRGELKEK